MQADKKVFIVKKADKKILIKNHSKLNSKEMKELFQNSSEFDSSDYEPFLNNFQEEKTKIKKALTEREQNLLSGILCKEQEVKHRLKQNLFSAFADKRKSNL